MLCPQRGRVLLQSIERLCRLCSEKSSLQVVSSGHVHSYSTDGSQQDGIDAEFQQRVAALQDSQAAPDLQAIRKAAEHAAKNKTRRTASQQQLQQNAGTAAQLDSSSTDAESSSSSDQQPQALWSKQYGYAVLGGVNPEASQLEAGAQQPKLHPTKDFKHGDMYDPMDLSPLSREEPESWLPKMRRSAYRQRIPAAVVKDQLDYKNLDFLLNFVSDSGRLKPRRATGLTPVLQARVARTVKMARQMALLPYEMRVGDGGEGDRWRLMRNFKAEQRQQQQQ